MSNTALNDAKFVVHHSPTTPLRNLVSLGDFAEAIGVTYSTISAYRSRGRLPEPAASIGRTPAWTRRQLAHWVAAQTTAKARMTAEAPPRTVGAGA